MNMLVAIRLIIKLSVCVVLLCLVGCALTPSVTTFNINDTRKNLKGDFKYNKESYYIDGQYSTRCVGQAKIENYGSQNYSSVAIKLTFYSNENELIAAEAPVITG